MKIIDKNKWVPSDGVILENEECIKQSGNFLIIAGPGAGKTELLAQKACYLLQTNSCKNPRKILAICFKKDAAKNLRERVKKRCGSDLSSRFTSRTFDSFAKGILDRFLDLLPEEYRPKKDYEVWFPRLDSFTTTYNFVNNTRISFKEKDVIDKIKNEFTQYCLPFDFAKPEQEKYGKFFTHLVKGDSRTSSKLTFPMIMRLSEYIITSNPLIKRALLSTYSHIFLDEFQDTTEIQYSFFKSIFLSSDAQLTAVGDDKQRIMVWAGADKEVFRKFQEDYHSKEINLFMNYRSAPRLINLQMNLIRGITSTDSEEISARDGWEKDDGVCEIWNFDTESTEANFISSSIKNLIEKEGLKPNDICIIVKQKPNEYCTQLINKLQEFNIPVREEYELQDLIAEECISIIINLITIILEYNRDSYIKIINYLEFAYEIRNPDKESKMRVIQFDLKKKLNKWRLDINEIKDKNGWEELFKEMLTYLKTSYMKEHFPQYKQGDFFKSCLNQFNNKILTEYNQNKDIKKVLIDICKEDFLPIMTIHKSKGLEYDTVIFIGLEDSAFWTFKQQSEEDKCAFFVALSRAKKRVFFTFCRSRKKGDFSRLQSKTNISELYSLLSQSKFVVERSFKAAPAKL